MEKNATDFVQSITCTRRCTVFLAKTAVHDDAESEEVAVAAQEQIHVETSHIVPHKLVDQ